MRTGPGADAQWAPGSVTIMAKSGSPTRKHSKRSSDLSADVPSPSDRCEPVGSDERPQPTDTASATDVNGVRRPQKRGFASRATVRKRPFGVIMSSEESKADQEAVADLPRVPHGHSDSERETEALRVLVKALAREAAREAFEKALAQEE